MTQYTISSYREAVKSLRLNDGTLVSETCTLYSPCLIFSTVADINLQERYIGFGFIVLDGGAIGLVTDQSSWTVIGELNTSSVDCIRSELGGFLDDKNVSKTVTDVNLELD